jgi:hypothetical protein
MSIPAEVVSVAKIAEYLWNDSIPKEKGFFNGTIDPRKPVQLYMERIALQYGISQDLNGIPGVTNYVYALCGAKLLLSKEILANGSSGGTVIPGGGGFGVREFGSFASANQYSISFPLATNTTLLYASRSANTVTTILTSGTPVDQQVVWDSVTGTLSFDSALPFYDNEYIRILVK